MPRILYLWGTSPVIQCIGDRVESSARLRIVEGRKVSCPHQNSVLIFRWGEEMGNSAVSSVYRLHNQGIVLPLLAEAYLFSSPQHLGQLWGPTQLPIHCIPVALPGVRQLRCEVDHSPQSRTEVTNEWSYISTTPMSYTGKTLPLPSLYLSGRSNRVVYPLLLT
jgi:hypothetical protein